MISLVSTLAVGFMLGLRHATDADHVVAVGTIVGRERSLWPAASIGMLWGVGHTLTLVIAGGAIVASGWHVPPRLGLGLELLVGVMLIGLGAWSLTRSHAGAVVGAGLLATRKTKGASKLAPTVSTAQTRCGETLLGTAAALRPLAIGTVHGLAGSAAVALLVLPIVGHHGWALVYLIVFGVGTIAGMMLLTAALALPFRWSAARSATFHRGLGQLAAMASIGFGAFLLYDIGVVEGLLVR